MSQPMSFGTLLINVLDSTRGDSSSHISISITQLVEKMMNEIGRSGYFRVRDVGRGELHPMKLYPKMNGNIMLHSLSTGQLYQQLPATQGNIGSG